MSIQVELTKELESFVADRVRTEGHASPGEYILALLKEAQQAARDDRHVAALKERIDALDRGEGRPMTDADWAEIREKVRGNLAVKGSNGCPT